MMHKLIALVHKATFQRRFRNLSRHWHLLPNERPSGAVQVLVTGFLNEPLGIGQAGVLTTQALEDAGYDVQRQDARPLHRRLLTRKPQSLPGMPAVWIIQANPPEARIILFAHRYADWASVYRIGYWVWETSLAPADWLDAAKWFHEIWVSSRLTLDALTEAFKRAGLEAQIGKLKLIPHPVRIPAIEERSVSNSITVLSLFDPRSDLERKNPEGVLRAWLKAFPDPGNARLVFKSYDGAQDYPPFQILQSLADGRPDIEFLCKTMALEETHALIAQSDIFISLHRGEGFSLPLAEAMSMGIPVIATGWSGNMTFMDADSAYLVPYRLVSANRRHNGPDAQWAEPDLDAAAGALRQLCADKGLRQQLGTAGRERIIALHEDWQREKLF